ncbi:MAG: ribosome-binding factor A, partial [Dolichospermum sp.]
YVRSELGARIRLRRTPEVLFVEDRSIERGTKVLSLLNQLQQQRTLSNIDEATEEMVE